MRGNTRDIEQLLSRLAEAHRDGAFASDAVRHPWEAVQSRKASGGRFGWVRVAVPIAAAAVIAIVFLGPSLLGTSAVRDMARDGLAVIQPDQPPTVAEGELAVASDEHDCDFNGDGVVDGRDIQAFVDRLRVSNGAAMEKSEELQRCLLGG